MTKQGTSRGQKKALTPQEEHERKMRVQTQGRASITRGIARAVVIKDGDLYFLTEPDGDVPGGGEHGYGLYYHDCRYLNGHELRLADTEPEVLAATAEHGFMSVTQLTNTDIRQGDKLVSKEDIGLKWDRVLDAAELRLYEVITITNYGTKQAEFPVSLNFKSSFEDIFAVRGLLQKEYGKVHAPEWRDGVLFFLYDGGDRIHRSLSVIFSPEPEMTDEATAEFQISLRPEETQQLLITLCIAESGDQKRVQPAAKHHPDIRRVRDFLKRASDESISRSTEIRSDSTLFNKVMERSLRDLHTLKTEINGEQFFAAGVPWFVTLFGRDSIITSLQTLAYDPGMAENTLRLLSKYQGQKVDDWRDEEPGKIMHELRIGEMANMGEIPETPYYGTIDATPLFLILLSRHAAWTGSLKLFSDLRPNVEAAIEWMSKYGDTNNDGYIEYQSASEKGLINQGWKDSGDALVNADGSLAQPPISLVEVQAYVYMAKLGIADLFRRAGEEARSARLQSEAEELRSRFNRDFWMEEKDCYAMALEAGGKRVSVISSNAGQALWTGICDQDKARRTMKRMMADDMYNGWGVRTLSEKERRYNPTGYHLGTVWPHDNSIIAAGFRRHGFDREAKQIFKDLLDAAMHFDHFRLPEAFSGFSRKDYYVPVRYPVACHPQAWAAGSVPFLLETMLGLWPDAFERRLKITRPVLPDLMDYVELRGLRVGAAQADLRFERRSDGTVSVEVLKIEGDLKVELDATSS